MDEQNRDEQTKDAKTMDKKTMDEQTKDSKMTDEQDRRWCARMARLPWKGRLAAMVERAAWHAEEYLTATRDPVLLRMMQAGYDGQESMRQGTQARERHAYAIGVRVRSMGLPRPVSMGAAGRCPDEDAAAESVS